MNMATIRFTPLEMQIMQVLWERGRISIREIQEGFPGGGPPGLHYRTDHRLSAGSQKSRASRAKNLNAHIF